jgi:DNA-binding transcriptional regulator LsrR (DeoR family)
MAVLNKTEIVEKFLKRISQARLAREYGTSRQRINQILIEVLSSEGLERIHKRRREEDASQIYSLIQIDPSISLAELAAETGLGLGRVTNLVKDYNLLRDKTLVLSEGKTKGLQKGRIRLTEDVLRELYLNRDMTAESIGRETGYKTVTINRYIQKYRLLKRPKT